MKFEDLKDAANKLGCGRGTYGMDRNYETVRDVVKDLVDAGNQEEVFVNTDSHLGLEDQLSEEFLNMALEDVDESKHQTEVDAIIYECENILPLLDREVTEELADDIAEDKMGRGEDYEE
jgi:hypothetical protein